jgi:predicted GNAT family N-acyltransferase
VTLSGDEALLALADAIAGDLVAGAAPVVFRPARAEAERESIFRLRYRTVVQNGWADAASMADGMERDTFDDVALHIGGWDGTDLVACARLVFPDPVRPLPTEEVFGLEVPGGGTAVDVGRGIVEPGHRDGGGRVFTGLLATCWLQLRTRGYATMCGDAAEWLIAAYRDMGFQVQVLGGGRTYWGEHRYPIVIDGTASVRSFLERLRARATG